MRARAIADAVNVEIGLLRYWKMHSQSNQQCTGNTSQPRNFEPQTHSLRVLSGVIQYSVGHY